MADPADINSAETPTPVEHATREPARERPATGKALVAALEAEGIIGLWCDRPESTDSSDYAVRLRAAAAADPDEVKRIDVLMQIFLDHLPTAVLMDVQEVQRVDLTGLALVRRLEGIRARHRLNPPDAPATLGSSGEVMRIICSDGLM